MSVDISDRQIRVARRRAIALGLEMDFLRADVVELCVRPGRRNIRSCLYRPCLYRRICWAFSPAGLRDERVPVFDRHNPERRGRGVLDPHQGQGGRRLARNPCALCQ